jgi:Helicase associated domain
VNSHLLPNLVIRSGRAKNELDVWYRRLRELWEYKQQFGDFSVEPDYKNGLLADWVANQRNNQGELSQDQEDALNLLGFEWEATSFKDKHWNDMFEQLRAYYEEHGDCKVPLLYKVILTRV